MKTFAVVAVTLASLLFSSAALAQPTPPGCGVNRSCMVYNMTTAGAAFNPAGGLVSTLALYLTEASSGGTSGGHMVVSGGIVYFQDQTFHTMWSWNSNAFQTWDYATPVTNTQGYSSSIASGSNAFSTSVNGARWDFGAGASDYASSDGTTVTFAGPLTTSGSFNANGSQMLARSAAFTQFSVGTAGVAYFDVQASGANASVPVTSSIASGNNAFAATVNGERFDFGAGSNDYCSSDGTTVSFAGPVAHGTASDATATNVAPEGPSNGYGSTLWLTKYTMPNFGNIRRWGMASIAANADTGMTTTQLVAPTVAGTPANDLATDTSRGGSKCPTTAVLNNVCGWRWVAVTRPSFSPTMSATVNLGATLTTERVWVGLSNTDISGADATAGSIYCAFRYSTGAADTKWQACSSDATTASCSDTGVTVTASATYALRVQWSPLTSRCYFDINGAQVVSKNTNISASTAADETVQISITALAGAIRPITLYHMLLEQN